MSSAENKMLHFRAGSRCRRGAGPTRSGSDRAKAGQPLEGQGRARPESAPSVNLSDSLASIIPALAEQLQQHHEKIDEVEIKRQRTHHRLLVCNFSAVRLEIHLLDTLGVVGGETDK